MLVLLCRLLGLFEVGTKQWPSAASGPQLLVKLSSLGQDISLQVLAALGMTMEMGGGVHLVGTKNVGCTAALCRVQFFRLSLTDGVDVAYSCCVPRPSASAP